MNCWSNLGTPDIKKVTSPKFICCPSKICNYIILYSVSKESPRWFPSSASGEGFARLQLISRWKNVVGWPGWAPGNFTLWAMAECSWRETLHLNPFELWWCRKANWNPKPLRNGSSCFAKAALTMWMSLKISRATAWKDEMADQKPSMGDQTPNETGSWRILRV